MVAGRVVVNPALSGRVSRRLGDLAADVGVDTRIQGHVDEALGCPGAPGDSLDHFRAIAYVKRLPVQGSCEVQAELFG